MMQFIVLGQVPGTHFQLTLIGYMVVLIIVGASIAAAVYYLHGVRSRKDLQRYFDTISLRSLDQA